MARLFLLTALLLSGCHSPVASRFRVVDGVNGQPIPDVAASGIWGMWQPAVPGLFPVYCRFPRGSGVSDNTGLVQFQSPANEVDFGSPDYAPCSIVTGWGGFKVRNSFDYNTVSWEDETTVLVRLQPLKQGQSKSAPP
jgi:hypothetical protein